ncbi:MAG TPA: glycosyltransferase family A protein [Aliidongia sp.]|nr:glycosyltransferase family A protein [Aliidongia sp.]
MFRQIDKPRAELQPPFDVAVVIPTVLRPELERAVRSVYAQDFTGRVQILVGIDAIVGDPTLIESLALDCPPSMQLSWLDPGYSTSVRHGGLYSNRFSGALRTILTYLANSRLVAYLDDDNWWAPDHLSSLSTAIAGADWAFAQRLFVEAATGEPICVDQWESVGPDAGVFKEKFGGFVDPSSLMVDKLACHDVAPLWSLAGFEDGTGEDRLVFRMLNERYRGRATGRATSYYVITPEDPMHAARMHMMRAAGISLPSERALGGRSLAEAIGELGPAPTPPTWAASAPETSLLVRELIARLKPRDLLVLAAGPEAATALTLAEAVAGTDAHLLASDADWGASAHGAAAANLAATALGAAARALPPDAGPATQWLARHGVMVDLIQIGPAGDPAALTELCRAAWPCLKAGGVLLGTGATPARPAVQAAVEAFAGAVGADCLVPALDEAGDWLVQKL